MLPSEVSAAVRPAATTQGHVIEGVTRELTQLCADLDRTEDQFVAAGLTDQDIVLGINTSRGRKLSKTNFIDHS